MNVGNQNEVGLGESRQLRGLGGIDIDRLASRLDQRAGVVQRSDLDRPGGSREGLRLSGGKPEWDKRENGASNRHHYLHHEPRINFSACHPASLSSCAKHKRLKGVHAKSKDPYKHSVAEGRDAFSI